MTGGPNHRTGGTEHETKVHRLRDLLAAEGYQVVNPHGTAPPLIATSKHGPPVAVAIQRDDSPASLERRYRHWPRVKIETAQHRDRRQAEIHTRDKLRRQGLQAIRTQRKSPDLVATRGHHFIAIEVITWGNTQGPGSVQHHAEKKRAALHMFDHVAIHPTPSKGLPKLEPSKGLPPDTDVAALIDA